RRLGLRAGGQPLAYTAQPGLEGLAVLEGDDAPLPERDGPRLGKADVVRPEPEVGADGAVERIERLGGAGGEAATPELVGGAVVRAGGGGRRGGDGGGGRMVLVGRRIGGIVLFGGGPPRAGVGHR